MKTTQQRIAQILEANGLDADKAWAVSNEVLDVVDEALETNQ